jgi:hypothetical protein
MAGYSYWVVMEEAEEPVEEALQGAAMPVETGMEEEQVEQQL